MFLWDNILVLVEIIFFLNTVDDMPTSEFGTPLSAGKRLPFVNRCKDAMYIRQ